MRATIALAILAMSTAEIAPAAVSDLQRAKQKVPRLGWKGDNFADMSTLLTSKLVDSGHRIRPCDKWSTSELQKLQRQIFNVTKKDLMSIYSETQDNRRQRFETLEDLEAHWAVIDAAASASKLLADLRRDGLCHESVMWAVHHLSSSTLQSLRNNGLVLPSLPLVRHEAPLPAASLHSPSALAHDIVHRQYEQQVSCQQCHTGTIVTPGFTNASLPPPLPVDKAHPGRERMRDCSFTAKPPCGPCDGLGGKRWGDSPEEMAPMKCETIHGPEVNATARGRYPYLGKARMTGETRNPLQWNPQPGDPSGPKGTYAAINGTIAMGDKDGMMRLKYNFPGMGSQISAQTVEQAKKMNVGATWGVFGGKCMCAKSVAGNFHAESFDVDDPLDNLHVPADQGGAAYLGRVRVTLDGDNTESQREAIADHYMKWVFHFLVDADEKSKTFGLPLRLYGSGGVRMVYDSWHIADPVIAEPHIWTLPKGCTVTVPECSNFPNASDAHGNSATVVV